tara:strand:- start:467 stop:739 length:273 start_codon:yes stop_codon:yes gene_type:complete
MSTTNKFLLFNLFSKKTKKAVTSKKSISFRPITSEFIIGYKKKPGDRKIKVFNWEFSKYLIVLIKKKETIKYKKDTKEKINISRSKLIIL